jgi:diacylglycerol O-acyltransferase / wax synthase
VGTRNRRLSRADRSFLMMEYPGAPEHIAGLCLVQAGPLLDANGELDIDMINHRLERRLVRVPELRWMVHRPRPLCGPPLWVDDAQFSLERHVHATALAPPGDEASLLETTELLLRPVLERSCPLWQLWFLTGLEGGRLGVLFKIHHAVADGLAAVALMTSLLDVEPDAPDPTAVEWSPAPVLSSWALLADSVRGRLASVGSTLAHPARLARRVVTTVSDSKQLFSQWTAAPRTSLNAIPGPGRRIRVVRLDLERARAVAHAHGAKVNDVVLSVITGGVRELLIARGERVEGLELRASVPATLRSAETARELGNVVGAMVVALPTGEPDSIELLKRIAASTRAAKIDQHPAYAESLFAWLAAAGLLRQFAERQRMVNFFVSNVPGPQIPLYVLGARIEDVMPIIGLAGNLTLAFGALSYCGRLSVLVNADVVTCPDIDVLAAAMERTWKELAGVEATASGPPGDAAPTGTGR